ncbi:MAG: hypothetical protein AMXMBFR64_15890 [Myxococcales bacterium]
MGESHLALLRELLDLLDRYAATVTVVAIGSDRETWLKVRGALEVSGQCAIDLALHIVATRRLGMPQTYRDAFKLLAGAGVIDARLAGELEAWAGLRNVLAHVYTSLDLERLHSALGETAPLRAFAVIAARELNDAGA